MGPNLDLDLAIDMWDPKEPDLAAILTDFLSRVTTKVVSF